jgi:hypothetical protein
VARFWFSLNQLLAFWLELEFLESDLLSLLSFGSEKLKNSPMPLKVLEIWSKMESSDFFGLGVSGFLGSEEEGFSEVEFGGFFGSFSGGFGMVEKYFLGLCWDDVLDRVRLVKGMGLLYRPVWVVNGRVRRVVVVLRMESRFLRTKECYAWFNMSCCSFLVWIC